MLKFYRHKNCLNCDSIQEALGKMATGCTTVYIKKYPPVPNAASDPQPPVLVDEQRIFEGVRSILDHLTELSDFESQWYKYQSDVCYCDQ